ncbi:MAG: alpha/beta fold hydrolase [Myxococcota bacterium]
MEKARSVVLNGHRPPSSGDSSRAARRPGPRVEEQLRLLRGPFTLLDRMAPPLAAWATDRLFFMPPRPPIPPAARAALAEGEAQALEVDGRPLYAVRFGRGPRVLLMHGWGGFAGQLLDFVPALVAAGFQALLFDAPGHGLSGPSRLGARQSSFKDFAAGIRALEAAGPLHGLVAHSGGAIAAGLALQAGLQLKRLALVAPMARPLRLGDRFGQALGLRAATRLRFFDNARARVGIRWEDLDLTTAPTRHPLPRSLVVHDRLDREVAWEEGQAIASAWPESQILSTEGLGHRRILSDAGVVEAITRFLTEPAPAVAGA